MLTLQELNTMKKEELRSELEKAQNTLMQTQIGVRTKHVKDTSLVMKQKRYIARIQTILREIELEEVAMAAAKLD